MDPDGNFDVLPSEYVCPRCNLVHPRATPQEIYCDRLD